VDTYSVCVYHHLRDNHYGTIYDKRIERERLMEKCIYCDIFMDKEIWEEEGNMCLECSNLFYDHKINPYDPDTYPKNRKGNNEER
jgi:hypothetical protein